MSKESLVEIVLEYIQYYGDGTGALTLLGLAKELENEFGGEFIVVKDSQAAKLLYEDKKE